MNPRITTFLVVCGQLPLAKKAITALLAVEEFEKIKLIIIANGLSENEIGELQEFNAPIIKHETRLSYSLVLNRALEQVSTEFFALLHPDAIVSRNWFKTALEIFDETKRETDKQELHELVGVTSFTSHALFGFLKDEQLASRFERLKPPTKTSLSAEEIDSILDSLYGAEGVDGWALRLSRQYESWYAIVPEIQSYCVLLRTSSFVRTCGKFAECFEGAGGETRYACRQLLRAGYCFARSNVSYVHHWGNLTTDGVGMNYIEQLQKQNELLEKTETE